MVKDLNRSTFWYLLTSNHSAARQHTSWQNLTHQAGPWAPTKQQHPEHTSQQPEHSSQQRAAEHPAATIRAPSSEQQSSQQVPSAPVQLWAEFQALDERAAGALPLVSYRPTASTVSPVSQELLVNPVELEVSLQEFSVDSVDSQTSHAQ